jgi:hypothetical protein
MPCTERPVLSADCSALNTYRPAPDSDCSAFDTLRFAPFADCPVIRIAPLHDSLCARHLAPRADPVSFRDSDCSAPRLAPRSTLAAPYPFGLLRVTACAVLDTLLLAPLTDCSALDALRPALFTACAVFTAFELRTAQGLLPARHFALRIFSDCSASRLAPCSTLNAPAPLADYRVIRIAPLHESLRARRLAFHAKPDSLRGSDCPAPLFAPCSTLLALCWSRIAPRSPLRVPHRSRIAPCSTLDARCQDANCFAFDTFRSVPSSDCSELWISPLHSLRRAWYLAFLVSLGLLRARHLASCVDLGLLRAQHLVLPDGAIRQSLQNRHC